MNTSTSIGKSKTFTTPVGVFDYTYLSHHRYSIGIDQKENAAGRFLLATPEKALADLIEARRLDEELLKALSKRHLLEISESYRSKAAFYWKSAKADMRSLFRPFNQSHRSRESN